jgi:hypothetical protein
VSLGRSIEDVIENLCCRSFFADFTIRSPKYYKSGGLEKEAADLLVIFDETLLAIQVKSKKINSASVSSHKIEAARVTKVVNNAIHQFKALTEALNSPTFASFVNGRGIEIAFDKKAVKEVILIVIFVPIWEGEAGESGRIRFDHTCYPDDAIPIHLFSLEQFSLLLTILNTLPDFLFYLTARWALHGEKVIPKDSDPADELAFITFERKKLVEVLEKHIFTDISGLLNRHRISMERLERQEKPSYFIDDLIERLCAAIGHTGPVDPRFNMLAEPNSLKGYSMTIPYFAKLNRNERAQFTEFLIKRVNDSEKQGIAFRGFKFHEQSPEAYLVLAARGTREERRIMLANIAKGMGFKLNVKTVVGLTVGHDWPDSSACDVAIIDVSNVQTTENLIEMTQHVFGKIRRAKR